MFVTLCNIVYLHRYGVTLFIMIGDRIRLAREALGMTVQQLGDAIGVTRATVSRWENNHIRPSRKLPHLAKALKKPVEWLQGEVSQPSEPGRIAAIERDLALLKGSSTIPLEVVAAWRDAPEQVHILCKFFLLKDPNLLKELRLSPRDMRLFLGVIELLEIASKPHSRS